MQLLGKVGDNGGVHRHKYGKLQKKAADEQPEREFFDWMPIDKPDEQNARGRSQCCAALQHDGRCEQQKADGKERGQDDGACAACGFGHGGFLQGLQLEFLVYNSRKKKFSPKCGLHFRENSLQLV